MTASSLRSPELWSARPRSRPTQHADLLHLETVNTAAPRRKSWRVGPSPPRTARRATCFPRNASQFIRFISRSPTHMVTTFSCHRHREDVLTVAAPRFGLQTSARASDPPPSPPPQCRFLPLLLAWKFIQLASNPLTSSVAPCCVSVPQLSPRLSALPLMDIKALPSHWAGVGREARIEKEGKGRTTKKKKVPLAVLLPNRASAMYFDRPA
ncbi:hypothetical protein B0H12DRAFT_234567 [Mycena haematopus]|nr:hypothetical protein B0H12DRAFT_234567 [Mycena haematopus]